MQAPLRGQIEMSNPLQPKNQLRDWSYNGNAKIYMQIKTKTITWNIPGCQSTLTKGKLWGFHQLLLAVFLSAAVLTSHLTSSPLWNDYTLKVLLWILWKLWISHTTHLETHRMSSTSGLEHSQCSNTARRDEPSAVQQRASNTNTKRIPLCSNTGKWGKPSTDNFLQCFVSHLAPGIVLELRYCHLGTPP